MTPFLDSFHEQLATLDSLSASGVIWVAYSGGMDSHVLLQLAVDSGLNTNNRLRAVHIHHGLDPAADEWAVHCRSVCDRLGVGLQVYRVEVSGAGSLENRARQARYKVFEGLLGDGDLLLQGHHADDQAETMLLRLMRGSGVRGLASIPHRRSLGQGLLLRPLLACSRAQLRRYAEHCQLNWIDDPSNADTVHDRNYLRAEIMPRLVERWSTAVMSLNHSAHYCADAQRLSRDLAEADIKACLSSCSRSGCGLEIEPLSRLADYRRDNVLRHWLYQQAQLLPDEVVMRQLWGELANARQDAQPVLQLGEWQLRRFDGVLYLLRAAQVACEGGEQCWLLARDGSGETTFAGAVLRAVPADAGGLLLPASRRFQLRLRQGGERIRLPGRDGSRSLKKLLQQQRVPPWLRQRLPLLYHDGELVAVADLWIADGYLALAGQVGIRLSWHVPAVPDFAVAEGEF